MNHLLRAIEMYAVSVNLKTVTARSWPIASYRLFQASCCYSNYCCHCPMSQAEVHYN